MSPTPWMSRLENMFMSFLITPDYPWIIPTRVFFQILGLQFCQVAECLWSDLGHFTMFGDVYGLRDNLSISWCPHF